MFLDGLEALLALVAVVTLPFVGIAFAAFLVVYLDQLLHLARAKHLQIGHH